MGKSSKNTPQETPAEKKKIDEAFQTLLASQRDILSQLNFGNSSTELDYSPESHTEECVPVVSPHGSREFDTGKEYQIYHDNLKSSVHSVGVGDDRFILQEITIEGGDKDKATKTHRKREMDRPERVSKKRRRSSCVQYCADLLPGPSELDELDDDASTSSLLLDDLDLDFSNLNEDIAMWEPDDEPLDVPELTGESPNTLPSEEETSCSNSKMEEADKASSNKVESDPSVTMEKESTQSQENVQPSLLRTVTNDATELPVENSADDDMDCSIKIEDLEFPRRISRSSSRSSSLGSQQKTLDLSGSSIEIAKSDMPPKFARANSTEIATVDQLSKVLQKSNSSMKLIQEWDRKMGLKRSHSKTMQLSRRSREQLLAFLDKEREKKKQEQEEKPEQSLPAVPENMDVQGEGPKPAVIEA